MSGQPFRLRLSPALRELVGRTSPNASAGLRALLLLGASAVGYDLAACRADLGRLLGEELDPQVRAAIDGLYSAGKAASYAQTTGDLQPASTRTTGDLPPQDRRAEQAGDLPPGGDPLLSVGLDV